MALRGCVLQSTYRIERNDDGSRVPVVHVYGRLEDGRSFLVRDDRQRPHFYIRADDCAAAVRLGAPGPRSVDKRTFAGEPVHRRRDGAE